jgi:hypothetical protein
MGWIGSAGILLPAYVKNQIKEDLATKKAYVKVLITREAAWTADKMQGGSMQQSSVL